MIKQRKRYSGEFKARAALEVVKAQRGINEIASEYEVHPNQLMQWKRQLMEGVSGVFSDKRMKKEEEQAEREGELYKQIGQLKVELDWMKKKSGIVSR